MDFRRSKLSAGDHITCDHNHSEELQVSTGQDMPADTNNDGLALIEKAGWSDVLGDKERRREGRLMQDFADVSWV